MLTWYDPALQVLGTQVLAMNEYADYTCNTTFTDACTVGPGYVHVREPGP